MSLDDVKPAPQPVVVAMIFNIKSKRYHPIVFAMTGMGTYNSRFHHEVGFEKRDVAMKHATGDLTLAVKEKFPGSPIYYSFDQSYQWDARHSPALTATFSEPDESGCVKWAI